MMNLLHIVTLIITFCVCFNWVCTERAVKKGSKESCSHTIQVSSLFPSSSSSCVLSSKASESKSSLHVVHRHGPCSSLSTSIATTRLDHDNILRLDKARVDSIHSKLSKNQFSPNQLTELQANHWVSPGSGTYVVKIGIGTPSHDLSLMFDTGSDLTWTQCKPCDQTSCYNQKEPMFDPSLSSSFSNASLMCASLKEAGLDLDGVCSASECCYDASYADESITGGFLAKEKFTLTDSDVFDGVNFGCGIKNKGLYYGVAGLLGLGRGELSFPSQTASTYNNIFSYCIPSYASFSGHLTFGSTGISNSVKFTPMSTFPDKNSYGASIVGIAVCSKKLNIPSTVFSSPGGIIDSGTVITRLPPKAYAALRSAFREKMSNYKTAAPSKGSEMDTCYDFTGLKTVTIPKISFYFSGGAVVELDPKGVLYPSDMSRVCLAFIGNKNDGEVAIFGNIQQQTLQVVYDGAGGRVGFAPNGCS